jgi:indolepyruvate ferredoxin oxidoreductase alpha subunit
MVAKQLSRDLLLGDEAVALGAVHAGISAAYSYPGTPSTEILDFLIRYQKNDQGLKASWCANEKTAYESALGMSFAGRRVLVSMKHVGLNVAADAFINSALVAIKGGLVLAVADDPGMHSSQNEQDSRMYADLAKVICLEPSSPQEAYDMTREAFDLSERFFIPVMLRLVTNLAHTRTAIRISSPTERRILSGTSRKEDWVLLPSNARRRWSKLLARQSKFKTYSHHCRFNFVRNSRETEFAVVTVGLGYNYLMECINELQDAPFHMHVGVHPLPLGHLEVLAGKSMRILCVEEGYPLVERQLKAEAPRDLQILGKDSGHLPLEGELNTATVRKALGLVKNPSLEEQALLPGRPPRLCQGCPHSDTFRALKKALASYESPVVTSDIGCYTLAAIPPDSAIESCVCMGASIGMARGAADAGLHPVIATIGDSTFLHSGLPALLDAVASNSNLTLIILDNSAVAMTGGQPTVGPAYGLEQLILGFGVDSDHLRKIRPHPAHLDELTEILEEQIAHQGLSVVIAVRECVQTTRKSKGKGI